MLKEKIIIYGTGSVAKEVIDILENGGGGSIVAVANRANQNNVTGKEVCSLEKVAPIYHKAATVVICIFNVAVDIQALQKYIATLGFTDIVTYAELFEHFEDKLNDNFYMTSSKKLLQFKNELEVTANLWSDVKSKKTYESLIKFRMNKKYVDLIEPEGIESQYLLKDLKLYKNKTCFVDCGAYTGDTYRELINSMIPLDKYIAFEPDLLNYTELVKEVSKYTQENETEIEKTLIPCGTYDKTIQLSFSETGGSGSSINALADNMIQSVSIDDCLAGRDIHVIKMDIEGAEYATLLGAEKVIRHNHPVLMICVYHKMEDIFRIPLLIKGWNLDYKFYLRMHGESGFETVMYAIRD